MFKIHFYTFIYLLNLRINFLIDQIYLYLYFYGTIYWKVL